MAVVAIPAPHLIGQAVGDEGETDEVVVPLELCRKCCASLNSLQFNEEEASTSTAHFLDSFDESLLRTAVMTVRALAPLL